jgi:peptide chain release factor 1
LLETSVFDLELVEVREGFISFQVKGKKAKNTFKNEAGGHRWQRVPPTEKRGRIQTSTITVAVLELTQESKVSLNPKDLKLSTRRGSGPGGQHRNKTDSCVDLVHLPTNIKVTVDGRSQHQNKELALQILSAKLKESQTSKNTKLENKKRQQQIGCGMRGDKRRTIRTQDNTVTDHILGKTISYKKYIKGEIF